jgi:hypothetical protein
MSKIYAGAATSANIGSGRTCTANSETCTTSQIISEVLALISPEKTWAYIGQLTGRKERAAKYLRAGTRRYTAADLAKILHSENGFTILAALMAQADAKPKWWRVCAPLMEVAEVQAMQIRARKKMTRALEGAVDADHDLTATIARAETILVHDADFGRPHVDAVRSFGRVSHRAVAQAASKGRVK